jgi:hypothetical protein
MDSMFDQLVIGEEDFDGFVLEEDEVQIAKSTRSLAGFSAQKGLAMRFSPKDEMLLRRISLQYRVLSKGMEEGDEEKSLAVRDRAILFTPYDCLSDPDLVKLEYMLVWGASP